MKTYKLLTEPRSSSIFTRHAIHHHSSNTPTYTEKLRFKTCTSTSSRYQERKATFARSPPLREKTNIMPLHEKKAICSVELQPAVIASTARARQCTFTIIIALARAHSARALFRSILSLVLVRAIYQLIHALMHTHVYMVKRCDFAREISRGGSKVLHLAPAGNNSYIPGVWRALFIRLSVSR